MNLSGYVDSLKGKRVAVIGAGISNTPLIERLICGGIQVTVLDAKTQDGLGELGERLLALGAKLKLGTGYLDDLDFDVIFRTPGLMPTHPALRAATARGAVLTSEMEVFFELCPCRIIAVTGSDGKTTTTSIIADLLKRAGYTVHVGGNIGAPLLCSVDEMRPDDMVVLELSSFQLITMERSPEIAVVTNVAPNHLDVHSDFDEYVEAKRNILKFQDTSCVAVLNYDNEITRGFADDTQGRKLYFSRANSVPDGLYIDGGVIYEMERGARRELLDVRGIRIPGRHNAENFMAAFAACKGLVSREDMINVAQEFTGVAHRIELIRELRGVRYYNDSIASSPSRTIAGLRAFDSRVILIAGGKDKGVPFDELGPEIIEHVKTLVLTGLTAERIRDAVTDTPGYIGVPEIIMREDFYDAVLAASNAASDGDIVLLSPACTSFDRFKNFEERGRVFSEIIMGLE